MPTRSRRARPLGRSQRRKLVWSRQIVTVTIPAGGLGNIDLLSPFEVAGASKLGITIMRTHLEMKLPVNVNADQWSYGLVVDRTTEKGAGLGPNPAASTDMMVDWAWWKTVFANSLGSGATIVTDPTYTVDVRAKRKLQELDETFLLQLANGTAASQTPIVASSVLLALP